MITTQTYDVAIVGGGMVGLATACGLAEAGVKTLVIDAGRSEAVNGHPRLRVSAINQASRRLLTNLGAWQYLDADRTGPYRRMEVWDKDGLGKIQFDAQSLSESALGAIVENDAIAYALSKRAAELAELTHLENVSMERLAFGEREAWLTLSNGEQVSAALVVAADGAQSQVRSLCQIPLTFWDYGHHAIVATVRTELPHGDTARQAFLGDGVLAFLPLHDPHLCSIVWSVSPEQAAGLLSTDDDEFGKRLTVAMDGRMGLCTLAGDKQRQSFPLRMRYARHFARHRLLLAGDAAHTIHPLAGQGVNLGFLDAGAIIDTVTELKQSGKDIGEYRHLRALERARKADALEMIAAMEGFRQLFAGSNPIKRAIRDLGLNLVDSVSPLKTLFIQQAMGKKSGLPALCR
ncbi:FAD-dependent monooxygenase [Shewanella sp. GXUN23E]|uniref:FAD-dependent monooxygenase n=1 Tax=Shewanella sp. GXUN23E TaxID=3422498 RepID=UPI003D7E58D3